MIKPLQHVEKARRILASGHHLLRGDFTAQAGRDAYLAAFHAALAFIVARSGKEPKTHGGVRSEFARWAQQDDRTSGRVIYGRAAMKAGTRRKASSRAAGSLPLWAVPPTGVARPLWMRTFWFGESKSWYAPA